MCCVYMPSKDQRAEEKRASVGTKRNGLSLPAFSNQVSIPVGLYFPSRCYESQPFTHIHFTMSPKATNAFWIMSYLGLFVSFLYEEGHIGAQILVTADVM